MGNYREFIKDKKRIVIKIGSSSLMHEQTGRLDLLKIEKLVRILIDIKNDQWELIKTPEKLDYIFDQKHNVKQMLEDYTSNRVIPSQRDSFRKFADINTLMTRLEQSRYLEYTVENINSRWYMIAIVPQSYD